MNRKKNNQNCIFYANNKITHLNTATCFDLYTNISDTIQYQDKIFKTIVCPVDNTENNKEDKRKTYNTKVIM